MHILLLRKEICEHVYLPMRFEVKRKLQTFEEVVEWILFKELAQELASHSPPLSSITFRTKVTLALELKERRVKRSMEHVGRKLCWSGTVRLLRNTAFLHIVNNYKNITGHKLQRWFFFSLKLSKCLNLNQADTRKRIFKDNWVKRKGNPDYGTETTRIQLKQWILEPKLGK